MTLMFVIPSPICAVSPTAVLPQRSSLSTLYLLSPLFIHQTVKADEHKVQRCREGSRMGDVFGRAIKMDHDVS